MLQLINLKTRNQSILLAGLKIIYKPIKYNLVNKKIQINTILKFIKILLIVAETREKVKKKGI